jgi:hypothetical protein
MLGSLLVWNGQTGEILGCAIPPKGDAPLPSVESILRSMPHLIPLAKSAWIPQEFTTLAAKREIIIVDGVPKFKESGTPLI